MIKSPRHFSLSFDFFSLSRVLYADYIKLGSEDRYKFYAALWEDIYSSESFIA
jgi:hypothetical protein